MTFFNSLIEPLQLVLFVLACFQLSAGIIVGAVVGVSFIRDKFGRKMICSKHAARVLNNYAIHLGNADWHEREALAYNMVATARSWSQ